MHDLVHDLALSVMVDGVLEVGKQSNTGGSKSLSALLSDGTKSSQSFTQYSSKISAMRSVECEKIVLYGASTSSPESLPFLLCGQIGIHEDVFSFAEYLRVLDFSEYSIQELPNSIGDLKQLRYLSVSRLQHQVTANCITTLSKLIYLSLCGSSNILALSESIGEMEGLMYLDLSGCSRLEKLPLSFGKLKELVHLDLSKCSQVTNISESLERLTKLEYLNLSYCSNIGGLPKHLGSLLHLRNLDLSYSSYIDGRANVTILVTLTKLECLNLTSKLSFMENLTETLRRLNNLKYLNVSCVDRGSHGMGQEIRFRNLKNLPECKGVHGILEVLGSLTKLQYLNLSGFSCYVGAMAHLAKMSEARVKTAEISNLYWRARETFATFLECIISKLPNLEHLDLSYNDPLVRNLPNCFGSHGKLHTLNLSGCKELRYLPANLYEMDSLRFLDLTGCLFPRMPEQAALNKSLLTLPHFVVQADWHDSSSNLFVLQDVNRTDLMISRLENVKSAQEARNINLKEKSRMEKMELNWTKDVERSVDDMEVLGELVPPTTLKKLKIDGYNSVTLPEWFVGSIVFYLPNLLSISMSNFPNCNSLPPLGQLPNLTDLALKQMNGISEINWDSCGCSRAFPQLMFLTLYQMESVNCLPPLGLLPNLKSLVLERMNGISEITWDLCGSSPAFPRLEFLHCVKWKASKCGTQHTLEVGKV
jgi:Leucine-rich repeat (LRR) protein